MNHSADETRASLANNLRYFIKWSLIALLIGGTGGLIGSLFSMGVSFATSFRMNHPNMLFFLPVSGILIVWLYHTFHEEGNRGTNMVIDAISSTEKVTLATGPLIFVSYGADPHCRRFFRPRGSCPPVRRKPWKPVWKCHPFRRKR